MPSVTITTQSAEKIYRADASPANVNVRVNLASGASLAWLPQETLLFSGARLDRRFHVDLDREVSARYDRKRHFGRGAMGEQITSGAFHDHWRIPAEWAFDLRRRFSSRWRHGEELNRAAIGNGARAIATFLCISPNAKSRLDEARAALSLSTCESGASAWNGMLVVRFAAVDPAELRSSVVNFLEAFARRQCRVSGSAELESNP